MKVLVGIGGAEVESLLERAAERIAPGAEWIVVHITPSAICSSFAVSPTRTRTGSRLTRRYRSAHHRNRSHRDE